LRNQDITFQAQGLKAGAFKLWVNLHSPALNPEHPPPRHLVAAAHGRGVAVQVDPFEKQDDLKPGYHFIGFKG
jgi:hypothetical protein